MHNKMELDIHNKMALEHINIRSYDGQADRARVEALERRCEVGPVEQVFLYTDTMGDPICRIRNSPLYNMLVAELNNEIVGMIQGSIKLVRLHKPSASSKDVTVVGYILALRVSPHHRRRGIGSMLVDHIEEWFISNQVHISYMATEKDNEASVKLFIDKLGYAKFRTPSILVHPTNNQRAFHASPSNINVVKLKVDQAEFLYRKFMGSAEFFPQDIDKILEEKLSLGTWVAYYRNGLSGEFGIDGKIPNNWAMLSVWNSGGLFKLRLGKQPLSCFLYAKSTKLLERFLPCFNLPTLPDFLNYFGFYFMYGVYRQGPSSGKLVTALCKFVHDFAKENDEDCKVVVTEIGGSDKVKPHIPHWKLLSCPEDLWCIKALRNEEKKTVFEMTNTKPRIALFVDPREV